MSVRLRDPIAVLLVLIALSLPSSLAISDPMSGVVRILYIGDCWGSSPVPEFRSDPAFAVWGVDSSLWWWAQDEEATRKLNRRYLPRSVVDLVGKYDVVILSDAGAWLVEERFIGWAETALEDHGLGWIMVGGLESFGVGGWGPNADEEVTPNPKNIEDLFPVEMPPNFLSTGMDKDWLKVQAKSAVDHPFTRPLDWSKMPYFFGTSLVALKQGAVELLESDVQVPYLGCLHIPVLSYWNYGKGRSVAHAPDWTPKGGELLMLWEYYPDYVANIVFLATQNHIPEDVGLVHDLRIAFRLLDADVASVFDLVGFVEMFGAETRSLQEDLIKLKERASGAEGLYVGNDYEGALEAISETEGEVTRLLRGALRLKNRTMIWIYLVEWLVITGAALVTGSVVWEIMVRRRLYRAVESTRQAPRL